MKSVAFVKTVALGWAVMAAVSATQAQAHASFVSGLPFAGKSYVATLNIGHGCEEPVSADTIKVEVSVPAGISSIRPADAVFGPASLETSDGKVTKMIWNKPTAAQASDTHFYQVTFKLSIPAGTELTTLAFDTVQTCSGNATVAWTGDEAPKLKILPARAPGWNKYTAQTELNADAVASYFSDALIVWYNNTAYSANTITAGAIKTPLTAIPAGAEFWVKY